MSNLGALIERMVEAGMTIGEAGAIAAEIYSAGVASVTVRTAGAERTRRYRERHKASQNVTPCHTDEASPNVTERHKASQSDVSPEVPTYKESKKEDRRLRSAASRGTRLSPNWTLSEAGRAYARQEGFTDPEIDRQALQFLDYWIAATGSKAVKLDWDAAWRTWIRRSADFGGKRSAAPASEEKISMEDAVKIYAKTGRWSRHAPCGEPGMTNCTIPPEIFAKYGLLPDGRKAA